MYSFICFLVIITINQQLVRTTYLFHCLFTTRDFFISQTTFKAPAVLHSHQLLFVGGSSFLVIIFQIPFRLCLSSEMCTKKKKKRQKERKLKCIKRKNKMANSNTKLLFCELISFLTFFFLFHHCNFILLKSLKLPSPNRK